MTSSIRRLMLRRLDGHCIVPVAGPRATIRPRYRKFDQLGDAAGLRPSTRVTSKASLVAPLLEFST